MLPRGDMLHAEHDGIKTEDEQSEHAAVVGRDDAALHQSIVKYCKSVSEHRVLTRRSGRLAGP